MTSNKNTPEKGDFSIEDFFSEIEKAEDIAASKPLPQERLRNKRRLDREAQQGTNKDNEARGAALKSAFEKRKSTKTSFPDSPTGMSKKSPKSKANSVDRPTNLDGFAEAPQAGFNHQPSSNFSPGGGAGEAGVSRDGGRNKNPGGAGQPVGARQIKPVGARQMKPVGARQKDSSVATNGGSKNNTDFNHQPSGPGSAQSAGVTATVAALQNLIEHGRDVVEGSAPWAPHKPDRPEKAEGNISFDLVTDFTPQGDQPTAIAELKEGIDNGETDQVLLGVTGSGKTFTIAQLIAKTQRPALILAPNKTLAAQLYGEFKSFFPNNAVEYFVSFYDYYQPEAYVPRTDTYIEKESTINDQIDRMRHSATRAVLERDDVIIIASVSCIYGIGSVETYTAMMFDLKIGQKIDQRQMLADLVALQYKRADAGFARGAFRVRGDTVEIFPAHYDSAAWRISLFGDEIESITEFDPLTGRKNQALNNVRVYANSHYVTPRPTLLTAMKSIKGELKIRLEELNAAGRFLEAQRIEQRTLFDLEMMEATGSCAGIENYSRYLTGRLPGEPPPTLFEYLPDDAMIFIDESHVTIGQLGAMYRGDFRRKATLAEYGFRLPSCMDNRPLRFEEWNAMRPQSVYVSATPGKWEMEQTDGAFAEQIIRPTGLIDPPVEIRPAGTQVDDVIDEVRKTNKAGYRTLITTLTKKMAEDLTEYMHEQGIRVRYMHSDVDTLERIEIIRDLRLGGFDVLIGINLLREGLDIPECALVAILDADKEGFLRSETSLIQTIGRAARNVDGKVILYADKITGSMERALSETSRRREKQSAYNEEHNITPQSIKSNIKQIVDSIYENDRVTVSTGKDSSSTSHVGENLAMTIKGLEKDMREAATNLEFEKAARLRDEVKRLKEMELDVLDGGLN